MGRKDDLKLDFFVKGTNSILPKNGDEWDRIRDGKLPQIKHCSDAFNDLLTVRIQTKKISFKFLFYRQ
jgi:hypothetical protein